MTLVVGRIAGPRVAIASDTLLTEHGKPLPFQMGAVKSCMLPGDVCVSFSISSDTAARSFGEFIARHPTGTSFSNMITFFEKSSKATGNDYLIAFANPPRLIRILDGKPVSSLSKTAWIGDKNAYERFREFEARKRRFPQRGRALNVAYFADEMADSPASDLFSTMRNVSADSSVVSAGGFIPVISNRPNGFRFSVYCDMLFDWPQAKSEEYEYANTDKISLQASGENENFSIAQVSPGYMGMNLVAFYFVKSRKLFFFHGRDFGLANQCHVFPDVSANSIHTVLNDFMRADLNWLLTVTSPRNAGPYVGETPTIKTPGAQLAFMVDANTFPKSS
jgi:hypothetical protein